MPPKPSKTPKVPQKRRKTVKKQPQLREGVVVNTPDVEFGDESYTQDDSMLMPNDGESVVDDLPEDEQQELDEDQQLFSGNPAIIDAVFEWLDNEIADCDSIQAAHSIAKEYKVSVEHALIALDVCRKVMTAKKVSFQNIRDTISGSTD